MPSRLVCMWNSVLVIVLYTLFKRQKLTNVSSNHISASYLRNFHVIKSICNKKYQTLYWIYYETPHWIYGKNVTYHQIFVMISVCVSMLAWCMASSSQLWQLARWKIIMNITAIVRQWENSVDIFSMVVMLNGNVWLFFRGGIGSCGMKSFNFIHHNRTAHGTPIRLLSAPLTVVMKIPFTFC